MKIKNPELVSELRKVIETSPFYRSANYSINWAFQNIFSSLREYRVDLLDQTELTDEEFLNAITPEFQRENTKWSLQQQIRFIENILAGYKSSILFYSIGEERWESTDCVWLLDGLQRSTSVLDFQQNKFPVFGKFFYKDIISRKAFLDVRLTMEVYQFATEEEACMHYIDMNRGITHSPEDLESAYLFLEKRGINYREV
ncbi:DUF262 domain-containing protein [Vibrio crassostreae]|uniref:DUF262 domain-containing protein n=1 Tax=Vibrio crassostreae TaxID=246167 RepID=UPI001B3007C2|nr:DUF262 domain-containing protein [Vibrio crassostreae]